MPNAPKPPPGPPKRAPSHSDLKAVLDEQPERGAVHHDGVDGSPQRALPLKRTQTMPGMAALRAPPLFSQPEPPLPVPPPLPTEHQRTQRAPSTTSQTVRATPAAGIDAVRAKDAPGASLPPPSQSPEAATNEALRRRAEAAEAKIAAAEARSQEFERRERIQVEAASPATFPPGVAPSPVVAPPVVAEPATDEVLTWLVKRAVANRKAIYGIVAALGLGGGGFAIKTANDKPQPAPLTAAQLDAALDRLKTRKGGFDDQTRLLNEQLQLTKCLRRKVTQIGESVLPAPDHQGATRKIQPFDDDCPDNPRPLPDP